MFSDRAAVRRIAVAFGLAWLIQVLLHFVAMGVANVSMLNFFYAIGGDQTASTDESTAAFFRAIRNFGPGAAQFTACFALISLFVGVSFAAQYPRRRYLVYAISGAVCLLQLD